MDVITDENLLLHRNPVNLLTLGAMNKETKWLGGSSERSMQ